MLFGLQKGSNYVHVSVFTSDSRIEKETSHLLFINGESSLDVDLDIK